MNYTDNSCAKEFEVSTFVMKCLNEMYKRKKDVNGSTGFLTLRDDGTPLYDFRKNFMFGMETAEPTKPKTMQEHKADWFAENAPFGKELGYPDCCIKEFCDQPPALLKQNKTPSKDDKRRYKAGCINGNFTGFIPCAFHAKQITMGKITLQSLIQNRSEKFGKFPSL